MQVVLIPVAWFEYALQIVAHQEQDKSQVIKLVSKSDELQLEVIPWRIPGLQLKEEASAQNGLFVAERVERVLPVVPPETTLPHTPKW